MERIKKSIEVDRPLNHVYNQWTQFEEFPRFMEGIKEVRQLDDRRLHWRAEISGKEKQWTAKIIEQIPDHRIAWESESGEHTSGTVDFATLGTHRTQVDLEISLIPRGFIENAGDAVVANDLEHFKEFIENSGQETGAWRGTIREDHKSVS
ncbi:MAG TPA: SRPBCC family protein [Candidatus Udaeobacter sp.]|nr:SRPBCC family protein [Candidatus Udaeobacter sp.]